jgi:hypothetical protein
MGHTISVLPICLVDSRMPDESWEATVDDRAVRSKRRMARSGAEGADREGSVPRTASVWASASKLSLLALSLLVASRQYYTYFHPERAQTRILSGRSCLPWQL